MTAAGADWAAPLATGGHHRALVIAAFPATGQAAHGPGTVLELARQGHAVWSVAVAGWGEAQRVLDFTKLYDLSRFWRELARADFDLAVIEPAIFHIRTPANPSQALVLVWQLWTLVRLGWVARRVVWVGPGPQGWGPLGALGRLAISLRPRQTWRATLETGSGDTLVDLALTGAADRDLGAVARVVAAVDQVATRAPGLVAALTQAAVSPRPRPRGNPTRGQARAEAVALTPDPEWSAHGAKVTRLMLHLRAALKVDHPIPPGGEAKAARALVRWYARQVRQAREGTTDGVADADMIAAWWHRLVETGWITAPLWRRSAVADPELAHRLARLLSPGTVAPDPFWDAPVLADPDALSSLGFALALLIRPRAALVAAGLPWRAGALAPALAPVLAQTARPQLRLDRGDTTRPELTVIGLVQSGTGLGANLAMTVSALTLAGLHPVVRGADTGHTRFAPARPAGTGPRLTHPVRLLHLNADRVPQTLMHRPLAASPDTVNIGFLLWEFPVLPQAHRLALDMLDEVWVPSQFVADAYAGVGSAPVHLVKKAMIPGAIEPVGRGELGLAAGDFVFLVSFDFHSSVERKNPMAAVRAFQAAFSRKRRDVALLIKTTDVVRGHWGDPANQWGQIGQAAARDPRIRVLANRMSAARYRGLIAACDALVSPHRAEGFGYAAAEALMLGRPVIVTDYSGSTDLCDEITSFPVPYALIPATTRETIFPLNGATWAEIDHDALVETLRAVAASPGAAERRAAAGQRRIAREYSGAVQAERYLARLDALGLIAR